MLSFFKINDPLRLIALLFLLILIRLPIWLSGIPLMSEEIHWITLGQKLADGSMMYQDVWDNIAPLSAGVYWFAAKFFGGTQVTFFVIASILTFFQSFLFNTMLNRSEAYKQKTFIPGFLYLVFSNISYDFMTLSPILISLTFLLFGLRNILRMERTDTEQSILNTGIFFGLASLAYLPSFSFLLMGIFALASFRVTSLRRLFLAFVGFTIVWGSYFLYLYYNSNITEFVKLCILTITQLEHNFILSWEQMLILMILPTIIFLLGAFRTFSYNSFINSQQSIQQVMLIWVITASLSIIFSQYTASFQLILFVPSLAFFCTHELLLIRRGIFAESTLWVYCSLLLAIMYTTAFDILPKKIESPYSNAWSKTISFGDEIGKSVLVFGTNYDYYQDKKLATPYLNWRVCQNYFSNVDSYDQLRVIYNEFDQDLPETIIDSNNQGEQILDFLTIIKDKYERIEMNDGTIIFQKIK
ncbi:hypothetical protein EI427_09200 [Flammeovirga pectinis]|uniref:Glycosyltransferase RgtA/B/C/D-like domain-containing protein n=1 Tax=Flammeovirga pectinis TaxID=2494373 RepID=A0A3Q9FLG1_9BACT|nr:hypothetical protein [Flammeovirga pectinis]AZQ62406.1 hypothetical protein EI427_09200 [Flammeovirga pectinis]